MFIFDNLNKPKTRRTRIIKFVRGKNKIERIPIRNISFNKIIEDRKRPRPPSPLRNEVDVSTIRLKENEDIEITKTIFSNELTITITRCSRIPRTESLPELSLNH